MSSNKHIVITGGAGFIGSHLAGRLLEQGNQVTVIDNLSTGTLENLKSVGAHPGLRVITSTVSGCSELPEIVRSATAIYHLAAAVGVELVVKSPIRTIETNLRETEAILQAASENGIPLLITSTSEVYGKSQKPAFSESDDLLIGPPHLGRWSYACSKLMDEFMALAYARERNLPVVVTRLFNTVGPRQTGQYGMVLPRFIEAAKKGKPLVIFGNGQQTRCFAYVGDTVEALIRLQNCPAAAGSIFNVGSNEETTILELAKKVIEVVGSSSTVEYRTYDEAYMPGFEDMLRRKPITDKLFALVHFRPITPLRRIIEITAGLGG